MKKLLLFFIPIALTINSCGPLNLSDYPNPNVDKWIERTLPPSQVTTSGAMFFEEGLKTDIYNDSFVSYSVGGYIDDDGEYWYGQLMQDLGWRTNKDGGWSSTGTNYTKIKGGYLYINLKKKVSVYIYPGASNFNAFRVTLKEKTTD